MNDIVFRQSYQLYKAADFPFEHLAGIVSVGPDRFNTSKVGSNVDRDKKIRNDCFLRREECGPIDLYFFTRIRPMLARDFSIDICLRERYKVGSYSGNDQGFYNPHTDTQGGMQHRKLSMVLCLSRKEDYEGGEFMFPDMGQTFKFDYGDLIVFDSSLAHGVTPVTAGERNVLISFFFDAHGGELKLAAADSLDDYRPQVKEFEHPLITLRPKPGKAASSPEHRYLFFLTPNSGPGNQLVSVKEAWVLSKLLGRKLIVPPINQHYTLGNDVYWNFNELYSINDPNVFYSDPDIIGRLRDCYLLHGAYKEPLRIEQHLGLKLENHLPEKRIFRSEADLDFLQSIDEEIICLKHVFNNVLFTECPFNGASNAPLNRNFLPLYSQICSRLDFSPAIREAGDRYLAQEELENYLAVHLRYPDVMAGKSLIDYAGYTETQIYDWLLEQAAEHGIERSNIFMATNNPKHARKTVLAGCRFYSGGANPGLASFVEQYICARSTVFVMSKFNDYSKMHEKYTRSTWSSLVQDYRRFFLKLSEDTNLLLFEGSKNVCRIRPVCNLR